MTLGALHNLSFFSFFGEVGGWFAGAEREARKGGDKGRKPTEGQSLNELWYVEYFGCRIFIEI